MPDIRYVVLSDLHFGAKNSILTPLDAENHVDAKDPSVVLTALFDALETLTTPSSPDAELPTLVLLGDVLDLALSGQHSSAVVFSQFARRALARDSRMFSPRIHYVPGNHDHHLWELVRDQRLHSQIATASHENLLKPVPHSSTLSGAFPTDDSAQESDHGLDHDAMEEQLLARLIRRLPGCDDVQVVTAYPNLGLRSERSGRVAVLHHGHLLEPVYQLITKLKGVVFPGQEAPQDVHGMEAENHAWIDFVWGTLGQSGKVGEDITGIYEMFAREDARETILEQTLGALGGEPGGDAGLFRRLESRLLHRFGVRAARTIAGHITRSIYERERHQMSEVLTDKGREALIRYLEVPVRAQLRADFGLDSPEHLVFVFGHTHKPYVELDLTPTGYDSLEVLNTGGWVVDSIDLDHKQGAAVVLLDDDLHAVAVHCYHEGSREEGVRVLGAGGEFLNQIQRSVAARPDVWQALSEAAAETVQERQQDLSERISLDEEQVEAEPAPAVSAASPL